VHDKILGLLDYWIIGLLDYWIIGLLDWWIGGLMDLYGQNGQNRQDGLTNPAFAGHAFQPSNLPTFQPSNLPAFKSQPLRRFSPPLLD